MQPGFYFVEITETKYDWGFNLLNWENKIWLGLYLIEDAKVRYG